MSKSRKHIDVGSVPMKGDRLNAFRSRCAVASFRLERIDTAAKWRLGAVAVALELSLILKLSGLSDQLFLFVIALLLVESGILAIEVYQLSRASTHSLVPESAFTDHAEVLLSNCKIDFPPDYMAKKLSCGGWVIENESFNAWLLNSTAKIPIEFRAPIEADRVSRLRRDADDLIDYLAARIDESPNKDLHNGRKIALLADPDAAMMPGHHPVSVARTDYFTSFITNRASGQKLVRTQLGLTQLFADFSFLFPIKPLNTGQWRFASLNESKLSNHIGVSTLAFTTDGFVLLPLQGPGAQKSELEFAPTGSGSLDWADRKVAKHSSDLLDIIRAGAERELGREQTLKGVRMQTIVVGYFRWLNFGGQPEFLCLTKVECALHDMRPNPNELVGDAHAVIDEKRIPAPWTHVAKTAGDVLEICKELLEKRIDGCPLSVPLEVLLRGLQNNLKNENAGTSARPITSFLFPSDCR